MDNTIAVYNSDNKPLYTKNVKKNFDADNVYLIVFEQGNNIRDGNCHHRKFQFNKNFNEPIINHMENYYLSIVTMTVPATEIPLCIINNIQSGQTQTNPNLTDWSFCFSYNNNNYQQYVEYIPYNNYNVSPPSSNPPSYKQQYNEYYFVDNYNVLLDMFNTTLENIYTNMFNNNNVALGALGLTVNDAPFFLLNSDTNKFSLVYNKLFVGNGIELFFSDSFSVFFPGFWSFYFETENTLNKDHQFIFRNTPDNEYDLNNNFIEQQYGGTSSYLNSINEILITSQSLSTRFEYFISDNSSNLGYENIIFSLNPLLETPREQKSKLVYTATTNNYRLVDITSQGEIKKIQLSVFYTDNLGNIYPICIPKGLSAVIKLIFIKKSLQNYDF